jgi:Ca-activated chloride channel family protein
VVATTHRREPPLGDAPTKDVDPVAGLVDIPLPMPVSLWPQTWASRVAIVVLIVSLVAGTWWLIRRWRANRYRRAALAELGQIEGALSAGWEPAELCGALASLVRRTALAAFPRETVAALAGPAWLAFLDRTSDGQAFSRGAGRNLELAAYQVTPPDVGDLRALIGLVRHWIKAHHG